MSPCPCISAAGGGEHRQPGITARNIAKLVCNRRTRLPGRAAGTRPPGERLGHLDWSLHCGRSHREQRSPLRRRRPADRKYAEFPVRPNYFPVTPATIPGYEATGIFHNVLILRANIEAYAARRAQSPKFPVKFPVHGNLPPAPSLGPPLRRRRQTAGCSCRTSIVVIGVAYGRSGGGSWSVVHRRITNRDQLSFRLISRANGFGLFPIAETGRTGRPFAAESAVSRRSPAAVRR